MLDCLLDATLDVLKLIPFLFIAFLILEYIEHKMSHKNKDFLVNNRKIGPVIGGVLGAFPQCGFATLTSKLFSSRVITLGTLIAVYLSTSDEMLPIMLSSGISFLTVLKIIGIKLVIGIFFGFLIDLFYHSKKSYQKEIHHMCDEEDCHCEKGIIKSSIHHTLSIIIYLYLITIAINLIIYYVGEEKISDILKSNGSFTYFLSSLIGLIPNCASSVILTEVYVNNMITLGNLLSGLLTGCGVGLLVLFKTNKNLKENLFILFIIYIIGVLCGFIIDKVGLII